MEEPAIRVEGLGKRYRLGHGHANYGRLTESLANLGSSLRRRGRGIDDDHIWALRDVSLEIDRGQIVGVIGANGSGKSTLLKILSRITPPTEGRATMRGRIGSLLEVGTGFHPELTGRENIYLNGAILGMRKAEIADKFDDIVEFAEVARFLDTPVKRYSSGMYVRLAFAVAAHLEPDILLVDEVLAVGDVAFQQKSLDKMRDVTREGRTVLFVSHNMTAMSNLCDTAVWLSAGAIGAAGTPSQVIDSYLSGSATAGGSFIASGGIANSGVTSFACHAIRLLTEEGTVAAEFDGSAGIDVEIEYELRESLAGLRVGMMVTRTDGVVVLESYDIDSVPHAERPPGRYIARCGIPGRLLNSGRYAVTLNAGVPGVQNLCRLEGVLVFGVHQPGAAGVTTAVERRGVIAPALDWDLKPL